MGVLVETAADRRRRRTRLHLTQAAVRLFAANGYTATSTELVAAAADISRSTLFRYVNDKEDLIFGVEDDLLAAAGAAVRAASLSATPWQALHQATVSLADNVTPLRELLLDRQQVIETTPALQARAAAKHRRWEAALADALQDSYPLTTHDAALLTKLAVACFEVAEHAWIQDNDQDLAALLHLAFTRLPTLLTPPRR